MPQYLETGIRIISMPKVTEFEKVTVKGQNIEYFLIFQPRIHWWKWMDSLGTFPLGSWEKHITLMNIRMKRWLIMKKVPYGIFKWCTCLTGQTSFSLKSLFSPKWCLLQHSFGVVQSMGCKDPIPLGESSIWGICFICLTISSFLLSIVASGMPGLAGKLSFSTLSTRLPWAKCQDIRTDIPKIFLNIRKWKIITVFLRL